MFDPQMPTADHVHFEELCASVEDYETLPELHARPTRTPPAAEADTDVMDAEILAGLVSP